MAIAASQTPQRWLQELTQELDAARLQCVWTQWALLGATASASRRPPAGEATSAQRITPVRTAPVDPEALLLASLDLLDDEPRLADVLRGWLRANARLVSVQRLRNLAAARAAFASPDGTRRLGWLAEIARADAKDARWRVLAHPATKTADAVPTPRRKTPPPPLHPTEAPQLLLRLRLGFGVSVKADLLALLLAREDAWHTVRDAAAALRYSSAPLRRALDDLADGGFVARRPGHPVRYRADTARWAAWLELDAAHLAWGDWDARLAFAAEWIVWARASARGAASAYALAVHARALLGRYVSSEEFAAMRLQPEAQLGRIGEVVREIAGALTALAPDERGWRVDARERDL